ncbi:hypothetical protein EXIGLDRAFT_743869 [Exidia glandulosa HHB12029]|uniref:Transcription factor domain-containing protein n=1 Tax=Exidia glandulosa HHB12029 TaxID=1314781 RepID=A0A165R300_EXIGL|nr:hypothetical protein EXIGLDRAFT_743869 [Exidia glandulosa HHB12029]
MSVVASPNEIIVNAREIVHLMESILDVSTVSFDENKLPISRMHGLCGDSGAYVGRTALSAYTMLSHPGRSQDLATDDASVDVATAGSASLSFGIDCTFANDAPTPPAGTELPGTINPDFIRTLVDAFIHHCTHEFRFIDFADLQAAFAADHFSPCVLFACALVVVHCPSICGSVKSPWKGLFSSRPESEREDGLIIAEKLYSLALVKWNERRGARASIEGVETKLLQLQYLFTARTNVELAWELSEELMVDVKRLGLHRDPRYYVSAHALSEGADAVAKNLLRSRWAFHNTLLVNRWFCLLTGRPPALRNRDFDTCPPMAPSNSYQSKWRFHLELFDFNISVLGPILEDCTGIRAPPLVVIARHDHAIINWYSRVCARFSDTCLEGIALRMLGLHVRIMLFAPYTTVYAKISQDGVTENYATEAHEADGKFDEAADVLLTLATRQLAGLHDSDAGIPLGRLAWAPHHVLAAGGLLAVESGIRQDNTAKLQRAVEGLGYLRPQPVPNRACELMIRLQEEAAARMATPDLPTLHQIAQWTQQEFIDVPVDPGAAFPVLLSP